MSTSSLGLGSKWDGLSDHLLAVIYPVDATGTREGTDPAVYGPISDSSIEISANWQSPFESSGIENKIPAITNMLQSGALESLATAVLGKDSGIAALLSKEVTDFAKKTQGRSGMTKLNSTQVFTGAGPVNIPITMHFRAFDDPDSEVHWPIEQLAQWTLARDLAPNGSLASAVQSFRDGRGGVKSLLPSLAPQMVAFKYGGHLFAPMVIHNMSHPITVPRTSGGAMLHVSVQLTLTTLTALDKNDWTRARNGQPTKLFNN